MQQFGDIFVNYQLVGPKPVQLGTLGLAGKRIVVINMGRETVWIGPEADSVDADPTSPKGIPLAPSPGQGALGGSYSTGSEDGRYDSVPQILYGVAKSQSSVLVIELWGPPSQVTDAARKKQ